MKKFRILSCMLAVVMLLFTFVSCGSKKVLPGTWTLEEETLKTTLEFGEDGKGKATFEAKAQPFRNLGSGDGRHYHGDGAEGRLHGKNGRYGL